MPIPTSIEEQLKILTSRGITIRDKEKVIKYLTHIGYFRLSHYISYFTNNPNGHTASFDDIIDIYVFDRKFKLIITDILERVEVSVKANIINKFSLLDHNSHFFLEEKIFKNKEIFEKMFDSLEKEKSKNKLLQPRELKDIDSWELFQGLTLGSTTFFYNCLATTYQKQISEVYDFTNVTLYNWLLGLTDIRNICAHYDKLWGKKLPRFLLFNHPKLSTLGIEKNTIFAYILILHFFVKSINMDSNWLSRIEELFHEYPHIDKEIMGFSTTWKKQIEDLTQ